MPRYVVDASVVAKWVLPGEPYGEQSVRLKEDVVRGVVEPHAPTLLPYEVGSLLLRATRLGRVEEADAKSALGSLAALRIALHEVGWPEATRCLGLSRSLGLSVYDASYVALSAALRAPLITADGQLAAKARAATRVLHIKDY